MPTTPKRTPARKVTTKKLSSEEVTRKMQEEHGKVVGYCPMGCGQTLFLGAGGHVTCSFVGCPEPSVVDDILDQDAKEKDHIAEIRNGIVTIRHPLFERVNDELMDCRLLHWINERAEGLPPIADGTYRFVYDVDDFKWRCTETIN
jgi:hypothetical protein